MKIILATHNHHKVDEISEILRNAAVTATIQSLIEFPSFEECVEDGATFYDNAVKKALHSLNHLRHMVEKQDNYYILADDSGLEIDALDGKPGIMSARYAPTSGRRIERVLSELLSVPSAERTARFVCVAALVDVRENIVTRTGQCNGAITLEPRGSQGFGYDPIFVPDGYSITLAEMSQEEKNRISHRGNAFRAIADYLKTSLIDK